MQNLVDVLGGMPYPGRGIIAGRNYLGENVVSYFLTGRSDPSKKREFLVGDKTGVVSTHVTDPAQLAKGSSALLIYPAVAPCEKIIDGVNKNGLIVTNGAHTNLIYSDLMNGSFTGYSEGVAVNQTIINAFAQPRWVHDQQGDRWINLADVEPDAPNNTPRISLLTFPNEGTMHIIRKNNLNRSERESFFVNYHKKGQARLLTTYAGEDTGKAPLPSFVGPPLDGRIDEFTSPAHTANAIYGSLNERFRVSVVALHLDPVTGKILDKYIINPALERDKL